MGGKSPGTGVIEGDRGARIFRQTESQDGLLVSIEVSGEKVSRRGEKGDL